jgi:hypothetical protein
MRGEISFTCDERNALFVQSPSGLRVADQISLYFAPIYVFVAGERAAFFDTQPIREIIYQKPHNHVWLNQHLTGQCATCLLFSDAAFLLGIYSLIPTMHYKKNG